MINVEEFASTLKNKGTSFISGVPDTLLNDFCLHVEKTWEKNMHVIAHNEGGAIGLAAGNYLATGSVPLVYMQNSGIGNSLNPLLSLTHSTVYSIPMVLLIGWRGEPGAGDHPQHQKQGETTLPLMKTCDIPHRTLSVDNFEEDLEWAIQQAAKHSSPTALVVRKGVLTKPEKALGQFTGSLKLSREEAIQSIIESFPSDTIFVASTGRITRELFEIRNQSQQPHSHDFLNVGSMGHAISIAAGIAVSQPSKKVVCLDGDAASIMHMGALPMLGKLRPANLFHIVLNNGAHESVGGQISAGIDSSYASIAASCGDQG